MNSDHLDNELIQLINQGGSKRDEGFKLIVKRFGPLLYPQINRVVKNKELTKDCLQNVFIKVLQNISSFKGDSTLYSWMYRIAHNEALNFLAKEKVRSTIDLSDYQFEIKAGSTDLNQIGYEKINTLLFEAIATLPEKQAEVFDLKYFQDLKYSEISELTGLSEGGLKANYHHAVKKIEEYLKTRLNLL